MRKEFIEKLLNEAIKDEKIILMTGDLGYGVLEDFRNHLPKQFLNLGIAEQSMMGIAAGLAKVGFRPFVYSIGNFPTMRCMEQIRNDVAYMSLPVTIVALGSGFSYGTSGYSHHLIDDLGGMRSFDLDIYAPSGPTLAKQAVMRILENSRPAYVRLGRGGEEDVEGAQHLTDPEYMVNRESQKLLVLSFGAIATEVHKAMDLLKKKNIEIAHITVERLGDVQDQKEILFKWEGPIVTVEEHVLQGGFGTYILETLDFRNSKLLRIGVREYDKGIVGSQTFLRTYYRIDSQSISDQILEFLKQDNV